MSLQSEIKLWLQEILKKEKLKDFSVEILGNSEKGDGYMGDIVFVTVNGTKEENTPQRYNLVLKCSKKSEALRKSLPVQNAFLNEIYLLQTVLPTFHQFQIEKSTKCLFNCFPKCYGSYTEENMEIIALENLKSIGYELYPKQQPLSRELLELITKEYGKFHATSVAFQHEKPEEFKNIVKGMVDVFGKDNGGNLSLMFENSIDESSKLLEDDLDKETLQRWKDLKAEINTVMAEEKMTGLKVILHGDCWNNNFMFLHQKEGPSRVTFLDWQMSRYSNPVTDLSYFLLSCASEKDLQKLEDLLYIYHTSFVNHLKELGLSTADTLYPIDEFLKDWKKYGKYGLLMSGFLMKIVSTEKDEVLDIGQAADSGKTFSESFAGEIRNKSNYKSRIRPILEYAVRSNLI